jgi:hypothetical protein
LNLDLTPDADRLTGTVSGTNWQAGLWADRVVFNSKNPPPSGYTGAFTVIVPGSPGDTNSPQGNSSATVNVDTKGGVKAMFSLADGGSATLPLSSTISKDGRIPFYAALYKNGNGSLVSWTTNMSDGTLEGMVSLIKPPQPTDHFYPNGFTNLSAAEGAFYEPQPTGMRSIELVNGAAVFSGGNLGGPVTNFFTLGANDKASTNGFTLSILNNNGLLGGSVIFPGMSRGTTFKGAVLQDILHTNSPAFGSFNGTNQSGSLIIYSKP